MANTISATELATLSREIRSNTRLLTDTLHDADTTIGAIQHHLSATANSFKTNKINKHLDELADSLQLTGDKFEKTARGTAKYTQALNALAGQTDILIDSFKEVDTNVGQQEQMLRQLVKSYQDVGANLRDVIHVGEDLEVIFTQLEKGGKLTEDQVIRLSQAFQSQSAGLETQGKKIRKTMDDIATDMKSAATAVHDGMLEGMKSAGGLPGSIADSFEKGGGAAKIAKGMSALFTKTLIDGFRKAGEQLVESAKFYQKSGVQPFYEASARLLIQVKDLQEIMQTQKDSVLAVKEGAEAYAMTLNDLQEQTFKMAGSDPILSGKLAAAAFKLQQQTSSHTKTVGELKTESSSYLKGVERLSHVTNMLPERIIELDEQLLEDSEFREAMSKVTEKDREQVLASIKARQEEFVMIGLSSQKARELAVNFEKMRAQTTPVSRMKSAQMLALIAARAGLPPGQVAEIQRLGRKAPGAMSDTDKARFIELQANAGRAIKEQIAEASKRGDVAADQNQVFLDKALEKMPTADRKFFEDVATEATISGGGKKSEQSVQSLSNIDGTTKGIFNRIGEMGATLGAIFGWLKGNGLAGILIGAGGLIATKFLGTIFEKGLGALATTLLKRAGVSVAGGILEGVATTGATAAGGAGTAAAGAAGIGLLGTATVLAATGAAAYFATDYVMKKSGGADKLSEMLASEAPEATASITLADINARRAQRGQPPLTERVPGEGIKPGTAAAAATSATGKSDPTAAMIVLLERLNTTSTSTGKTMEELLQMYKDMERMKVAKITEATSPAPGSARVLATF